MRYRKVDASGDMIFGDDQRAYWRDIPEAPAQAVLSRLYLFLGEWFLDITDGTAWNTRVLGKNTVDTRDPEIRARILDTEGVTSIDDYTSNLTRDDRKFSVQATISTAYGQTTITGQPQ
ncbi:hypothetical protein LB518_22710 [Mesorhizobium sp. BR1-1-16]|uniref:hypothetical protein n=1 Tax=Mesorhizobium sp. BR1-1-16 TaxID=2876653 RepID=UPI001CCC8E66|nr:hypothetical protein [Mesorhizobium sp. BR1-1-16]MBZ9939126.1 hypothetical protein [Mesorhizobium sp. BR1-1-16]